MYKNSLYGFILGCGGFVNAIVVGNAKKPYHT